MGDGVNTDVGVTNGGTTTTTEQSWLSSVPENLRSNEAFKGIEKSSDAWQQFVDLKGGAENSVQIPGENATEAERTAFFTKLGRPETPDKYSFTKPENVPDNLYSQDEEKLFKQAFHEAGVPDTAAKKLWGKYYEVALQGQEQQAQKEKAAYETAINQLKNEWTGDQFKEKTEVAHRAFTNIFEDDATKQAATEFLEQTKINDIPLGSNPMMLKVFARIGELIGDDKINIGSKGNGTGESSEEAEALKRFPNTTFE